MQKLLKYSETQKFVAPKMCDSLSELIVCRRCGSTYTFEECEENRFCRKCETFLIKSNKVPGSQRQVRRSRGRNVRHTSSVNNWLPETYEIREKQIQFTKEIEKGVGGMNYDGVERKILVKMNEMLVVRRSELIKVVENDVKNPRDVVKVVLNSLAQRKLIIPIYASESTFAITQKGMKRL